MELSDQDRAERSVKALLQDDAATQGLGMQVLAVEPGSTRLKMCVTQHMLNGFSTCHGGYIFTLGDSAFGVACNSFNQMAVASSAGIEFLAPAYLNDELIAEANVKSQGRKTGLYDVVITNQNNKTIALFRGRSHRIGKPLFDESEPAQ